MGGEVTLKDAGKIDHPANTQRNERVIITSKRCFDAIISCLLPTVYTSRRMYYT